MPFKMIANRHVYRFDEKKEYKKGESFTVNSETEKNRLLRNKRARLDDTPAPRAKAQMVQKVVTSETSTEPPPETPSTPAQTPVHHPEGGIRGRYGRRDLRSEN